MSAPIPWPAEREATLRRLWASDMSMYAMAREMGTPETTLRSKGRRLRLPVRPARPQRIVREGPWTPALDGQLATLWRAGTPTKAIGAALGLGKNACIGRAHRLHLPKREGCIKPRPAVPQYTGPRCQFIQREGRRYTDADKCAAPTEPNRNNAPYCAFHYRACYHKLPDPKSAHREHSVPAWGL